MILTCKSISNLSDGHAMRVTRTLVVSLLLLFSLRGFAAPVDVNTADADALADALTGVGPGIAAAIVDYREQNGPFTTVDDLLNVRGVGPKILEWNKTDILIDTQSSESVSE